MITATVKPAQAQDDAPAVGRSSARQAPRADVWGAAEEVALQSDPPTAVLRDGRVVTLREPRASDLRGIKLLEVLQLDAGAHAPLVERISELTAAEFYAFGAQDMMAVMTVVVGFFAPKEADPSGFPPASRTPGP